MLEWLSGHSNIYYGTHLIWDLLGSIYYKAFITLGLWTIFLIHVW